MDIYGKMNRGDDLSPVRGLSKEWMPIERQREIKSLKRRESSVQDIRSRFTGNSLVETEQSFQAKIRNYRNIPCFSVLAAYNLREMENLIEDWMEEQLQPVQELSFSDLKSIFDSFTKREGFLRFLASNKITAESVGKVAWQEWLRAIQLAVERHQERVRALKEERGSCAKEDFHEVIRIFCLEKLMYRRSDLTDNQPNQVEKENTLQGINCNSTIFGTGKTCEKIAKKGLKVNDSHYDHIIDSGKSNDFDVDSGSKSFGHLDDHASESDAEEEVQSLIAAADIDEHLNISQERQGKTPVTLHTDPSASNTSPESASEQQGVELSLGCSDTAMDNALCGKLCTPIRQGDYRAVRSHSAPSPSHTHHQQSLPLSGLGKRLSMHRRSDSDPRPCIHTCHLALSGAAMRSRWARVNVKLFSPTNYIQKPCFSPSVRDFGSINWGGLSTLSGSRYSLSSPHRRDLRCALHATAAPDEEDGGVEEIIITEDANQVPLEGAAVAEPPAVAATIACAASSPQTRASGSRATEHYCQSPNTGEYYARVNQNIASFEAATLLAASCSSTSNRGSKRGNHSHAHAHATHSRSAAGAGAGAVQDSKRHVGKRTETDTQTSSAVSTSSRSSSGLMSPPLLRTVYASMAASVVWWGLSNREKASR